MVGGKCIGIGRGASRGLGTVVLAAVGSMLALSACAARHTGPSSRFITRGDPTVNLGERVEGADRRSLADYATRLRKLQAEARPRSALLPSIESKDAALARALTRLALQETAANHRLVAEAYRNAGINDYAHRHLLSALRLDRGDAAVYDDLARLWRDWGHPDVALGDVHRALFYRPDAPGLYNTLGTVLQSLGQMDEASAAFERALRLDRRASYALNNLCYVALQKDDTTSARRFCERALELEPNMAAARNNLALALAIDGEVAKAESRLLDSPDPAQGQYNVGVLRMSLGQYTQAVEAFELAATKRPSLWIAAQRAAQARALAHGRAVPTLTDLNYADR